MSFKGLSFREKTALIHIAALLLLLAYTLIIIWPFFSGYEESILAVKPLWFAILAFILIEVTGHSWIAMHNRKEANTKSDEREKLITLKSNYYASHILGFLLIGYLLLTIIFQIPFLSVYFVFIIFVVAEIINYSCQLVLFRRGV